MFHLYELKILCLETNEGLLSSDIVKVNTVWQGPSPAAGETVLRDIQDILPTQTHKPQEVVVIVELLQAEDVAATACTGLILH